MAGPARARARIAAPGLLAALFLVWAALIVPARLAARTSRIAWRETPNRLSSPAAISSGS